MRPKLKATLVVAAALTFATSWSAAQTPFNLKQMLATSPEAAMLGRFGETPIGYYTGTADVSIPLYTLKESGVSIPIVLRYHGSGIRVEDDASNVGLGWSIEPGGSIIQIVNGLPEGGSQSGGTYDNLYDFDNDGFNYMMGHGVTGMYFQRYQVGTKWSNCLAGYPDGDNQTTLLRLKQGYGQPDVYQYSFPGGSGKFYMHPVTHQPVLMDKKAEIRFVYNNSSEIVAQTLDGNKFYFDAIETTYGNDMGEYTGKTFKLSRIDFVNGKSISFHYQDGFYEGFAYNETYHTSFPWDADGGGASMITPRTSLTSHNIKMLTSIVTDKVVVNFNLEDRLDLYTNSQTISPPKRIGSIDIVDSLSNKKIKSYAFSYDYFIGQPSSNYLDHIISDMTPYQNAISKRLKLLSVREIGYDQNQVAVPAPPYTFSYNESLSLPYKTSYAKDYWGYYNGQNNAKLTPDLSFFPFTDDVDYQYMPPGLTDFLQGANRAPDSSKMQAWILKRLTYPTGGYTEYDYQPHTFKNHTYPDVERITAASLAATALDHNVGTDTRTINFTLPKTQIITFHAIIAKGTNQGLSFYDMEPSTITLTKTVGGSATVLRTWQMTTSDQSTFNAQNGFIEWDTPINLPYDPGAQYTLTVDLPDNLGPQTNLSSLASVECDFHYFSPPASYPFSYGAGLRIGGIRNYDSNGSILTRKSVKYINADNTTSGVLMSPYKPLYYRTLWGIKYMGPDETSQMVTQSLTATLVSSESAVPFSDAAGGNGIGYSRAEETEVAPNGAVNGKHVYFYNNQPSDSHPDVPDNPDLKNGLVSREEVYSNASAAPLSVTDYTYKLLSYDYFAGVKVYNCNYGDLPRCSNGVPPGDFAWIPDVQLCYYGLNSMWYVTDSVKKTENFNGQFLSNVKRFYYNGIGQVSQETTMDSKNNVLTAVYTYPYDIDPSVLTPAQSMLKSSWRYNSLLEQEERRNLTSISHSRITYDNINNQLVQTKIEHSFNSGPFITDVTFDSYGGHKTPLQVTERGSKVSALAWDDENNFIIAEVVSSGAADMAFTSFEPAQAGNWTIASTVRNPYGYTGGQSYNLSNGVIAKSGLNTATTYIVSYWTKNTGPFSIPGTVAGYPQATATINGWTCYRHQVSGVNGILVSGSGDIDELRLYPQNAQMKTFTFNSLVGVTSMTDPKDMTTFYEYDEFGRLKAVRDRNNKILKAYDYHYKQ